MAKTNRTPPPQQGGTTQQNPNRWSLTNWTGGPVTLFQALGLNKKGTVTLPTLTPEMTLGGIQSSITPASGSSANGSPSSSNTGGSSSGGPAKPPANASESAFIKSILAALGAPATPANINSLASWFRREFPSWPPGAAYNPMATTLSMPGATTYNSIGVRNYASPQQGVQATVLTLQGGYPGIVAALKSGNGLCGQNLAQEFLKWSSSGPGTGYSSVC